MGKRRSGKKRTLRATEKSRRRKRIVQDYPSPEFIARDPKGAMTIISRDRKREPGDSTQLPVTYRDVTAIKKILNRILKVDGRFPLLGMDAARMKLLFDGDFLSLARKGVSKLTDREKSLTVWLRRLIAADLYAQGMSSEEIAARLGVRVDTVHTDIASIAESQLFSEKVEDARAAVMRSINRLETLQKSAMMDLVDRPLPANERTSLRMEVTSRELYIFKTLKELGAFKAIDRSNEEEIPGAPGSPSSKGGVTIFVNAPQPSKPLESMNTEERLQYMETYMAFRRSNPTRETEAEFSEINNEASTARGRGQTRRETRKALPPPRVSSASEPE